MNRREYFSRTGAYKVNHFGTLQSLEHKDKMDKSALSEIHNNLGWVYTHKKLYQNAKAEFVEAKRLDKRNIKAIRNHRALGRIEPSSEITQDQIMISILLVLPLSVSIYFFRTGMLTETSFTALLMFFKATILFALLHRNIGKFSAGLKGVEFEMSAEQKLAPAGSVEQIAKFER
jgi:hypothetical protein